MCITTTPVRTGVSDTPAIEPAVAQAIKEYCLTDDAIEWIADQTAEYWEKADRNLQLDSIKSDLAAVQSSISNVMKAIEMGVVTETTRDRLIELEKQRTDLKSKLALAEEEIVHVDRKKLISSLLLLRNGDIRERQYQEDLFTTILVICLLISVKLTINQDFPMEWKSSIILSIGQPKEN